MSLPRTRRLEGVRLEKFVFGGQALARTPEGVVLVWGGVPGEEVEVEIVRKRRGVREGMVRTVLTASPDRIEPRDAHYLSCSPWQLLSFEAEQRAKVEVAREVWQSIGDAAVDAEMLRGLSIVGDSAHQYAYRNKMEFSFVAADGRPSLAFFGRASHERQPIDACALAHPVITEVAQRVLGWLQEIGVAASDCKSLVVRTNGTDAIVGLFVTTREWPHGAPELGGSLKGVAVYYSRPESPASVVDKVLASSGTLALTQSVAGHTLEHGLQSFFQVNVPIFERALTRMEEFVGQDSDVVELYAGVGSISIALGSHITKGVLVESDEEGSKFATKNVAANGLASRLTVERGPAEYALATVTGERTLIVDPPRVGLHTRLVDRVVAVRPPRIIYLSCNVSTQARDVALLREQYQVRHLELFNFFPRTPHIESLVVLERR